MERFNKTLKQMLKKAMETDGKNWDQLLPHVLFAVREVPQASTGFSPFELFYGRRPRGLLDLAKEAWESRPSTHCTMVDHVEQVRRHMAQVWPIVRDHLRRAAGPGTGLQPGAQLRIFRPRELAMVLIPTAECKFLAKWQGPYEVVDRVGEVNYSKAAQETPTHPALPFQPVEAVVDRYLPTSTAPHCFLPLGAGYWRSPWETISAPPRSMTSRKSSYSTKMSSWRYPAGPRYPNMTLKLPQVSQ